MNIYFKKNFNLRIKILNNICENFDFLFNIATYQKNKL
jgi:hypothetical protein